MCNLSSNLGLFPSGKAIDHHLGLDESILFKRADVVQVTGEGYRKFKESFLFGKLGTPVGGSHFGKGPADWRRRPTESKWTGRGRMPVAALKF